MQTPTATQLRTAIEVLEKLAEKLKAEAAQSLKQPAETGLGNNDSTRIEAQVIEEVIQIESAAALLRNWRDVLRNERRVRVSNHR
jgi:hypothetical protein